MKKTIRVIIVILACTFVGIGLWNFRASHGRLGLPQFRSTIQARAMWDAAAQKQMAQCEAASQTTPTALTQIESGEGLVVGEPIAPPAQANFGAGCGRWLQLALGGLGACGKTSSWQAIDGARQELGRTNFQLSGADVKQVARSVGATHVALGVLQGSGEVYRLSYRWVRGDNGQPIAETVTVAGTPAAIVAQLPALAAMLAEKLNLTTPPSMATGTAAELSDLGALPRCSQDLPGDAEIQRIADLSQRLPLAAITLLHNDQLDRHADYQNLTSALERLSPGNPMALKAVAELCADKNWLTATQLEQFSQELNAAIARYPRNYLLNSAVASLLHARNAIGPERTAAETAVRCAAANPNGWRELGNAISDMANSVRHDRYFGQMYRPQQIFASNRYLEWQLTASHALSLDPRNARCWLELSRASEFNGNKTLAARALDMSLRLNPQDERTYWWAVQFNQPKWRGKQTTNLMKVVHAIEKRPAIFRVLYANMGEALENNGLLDQEHQLDLDSIAYFKRLIARDPRDAYFQLEYIYDYDARYQEAVDALQHYLKLQPRNTDNAAYACFKIGEILQYRSHRFADAQAFYNRALVYRPDYGRVYNAMADIQQASGKLPESEPLYKKAILYAPEEGFFHANLGNLYINEGRYDDAAVEGRKALVLGTTDHELFDHLGWRK